MNKLLNSDLTDQEREWVRRTKADNYIEGYAEYIQLESPPARHHRLVCRALDKVVTEGNQRIMIFQPPGTAKSTYANVLFSTYYLGKFPKDRVINCSYNYDLAKDFGRKARNLVNTPKYRTLFGSSLAPDTRAVGEWEITVPEREGGNGVDQNYGFDTGIKRRGGYISAGVGSGLTGRRGNLGIIDDPVKDSEDADSTKVQAKNWDWYIAVFDSRLLPNASRVIIQTRWNENDLSGKILPADWDGEIGEILCRDGKVWTVICMPAIVETEKQAETDPLDRNVGDGIWDDYYSLDHWKDKRNLAYSNEVTKRHWAALYQQIPKPAEGIYFKRKWFEKTRFDVDEIPTRINLYVHSDFAVTDGKDNPDADWTEVYVSGMDEHGDLWMAIDGFYVQGEPDKWVEKTLSLVEKHRPDCEFHEGGVIRKAVEPFFKKRRIARRIASRVEWLNPIGDKKARLRAFQLMAASGRVHLPNNEMGERLLDHLVDFPNSNMDHGPDACSVLTRGLEKVFPASGPPSPIPEPKRSDYGRYEPETGGHMVA